MAIVTKDGVDGKVCSTCRQWKPVTAYSRRQRSPDGYQANCKICSGIRVQVWNEENLDRVRARNRAYNEERGEKLREYRRVYDAEHREQRLAYIHAYDRANKDRKRERRREYYRNNPEAQERDRRAVREYQRVHREKQRERERKWIKANPDKKRAAVHRRRAREQASEGSFTDAEWSALKVFYNHTCLRCGKREPEIALTPDHVIPVVKGGSSDISNIQPLCGSCNSAKGANSTDYRSQLDDRDGECRK